MTDEGDELARLRCELEALTEARARERAEVARELSETAAMREQVDALRLTLEDREAQASAQARASEALRADLGGVHAELGGVRRELERARFVTTFVEKLAQIQDADRRRAYVALLEARATPGPLTDAIELAPAIERAIATHAGRLRGVTVRRAWADDLPSLRGARGQLALVWSELIANAADALGGAGTLTVAITRADAAIVVAIDDDGPGLHADDAGAAFEPFTTRKPPALGLGVGLHVARWIVERHAGRIALDTSPGGTRVTVTLPVA